MPSLVSLMEMLMFPGRSPWGHRSAPPPAERRAIDHHPLTTAIHPIPYPPNCPPLNPTALHFRDQDIFLPPPSRRTSPKSTARTPSSRCRPAMVRPSTASPPSLLSTKSSSQLPSSSRSPASPVTKASPPSPGEQQLLQLPAHEGHGLQRGAAEWGAGMDGGPAAAGEP